MENIIKAIERSKIHQQSVSSDDAAKSGLSDTVALRDIAYSKTKIVELNESVLTNNRVIKNSRSDRVVDAYRLLRTQILQRMREQKWNTLAVTSPTDSSGKSLTAINLAISLAMEVNQTVLLVDLDLRQPSIHNYLGYEPEYGISDYLTDQIPLSDILINPSLERLVVLPGRQAMNMSSERLSSPAMISLVEELKTRYRDRLILFDLPSLLKVDDVLAFSPVVDAALLVVEDGKTKSHELLRAMDIMRPFNIIGSVLNKGRL
jgi:Mrp family chromosome partitioning ATPase